MGPYIVRNKTNGACLVITGAAAILITSPAMLKAHTNVGMKVVECDENQFSRYEKIRKA